MTAAIAQQRIASTSQSFYWRAHKALFYCYLSAAVFTSKRYFNIIDLRLTIYMVRFYCNGGIDKKGPEA